MPPHATKWLNLAIGGALAGFLTVLALCYLFMRLEDGPALLWTTRLACLLAVMLVVALSAGRLLESSTPR